MASPAKKRALERPPPMVVFNFNAKNTVVTGAGSGIGKKVAFELAAVGANVIAISKSSKQLAILQEEVSQQLDSPRFQTLCLDISKWDNTKEAVQDIKSVDFLINNAGMSEVDELGDISEQAVNSSFNTNIKAIINITQLLVKGMRKGGSIVNVSCVIGYRATSHASLYCASKGAVDQLTRCMAIEYGPRGIRVNSVNPTVTRSTMAVVASMFNESDEHAKKLKSRHPMKRFNEAIDVVGPIFFLLSSQANMVTGVTLPVDGGISACFL